MYAMDYDPTMNLVFNMSGDPQAALYLDYGLLQVCEKKRRRRRGEEEEEKR
jgi:hypothetical protein